MTMDEFDKRLMTAAEYDKEVERIAVARLAAKRNNPLETRYPSPREIDRERGVMMMESARGVKCMPQIRTDDAKNWLALRGLAIPDKEAGPINNTLQG